MVIRHGRYTEGYYVNETTKGSNPGGTFLWIGVPQRFTKTINPNLMDVRGTGSPNRQYSPGGLKEFDFGVEYYVQDLNFIKQAILPTATYKTYTVEIRDSGDGVTYKYWLFEGVALSNLTLRSRLGEILTATVTGGAMDLTVNDTTGIGTDPADPATTPWIWKDGSFKVGAANAPEIIEWTLNTSWNAECKGGFEDDKPRDNVLQNFDVTGTAIFNVEGSTYVDDILAGIEQDFILYLYSTTHYITVGSAKWSRLDQPSTEGELLTETLGFVGKTAVVTTP